MPSSHIKKSDTYIHIKIKMTLLKVLFHLNDTNLSFYKTPLKFFYVIIKSNSLKRIPINYQTHSFKVIMSTLSLNQIQSRPLIGSKSNIIFIGEDENIFSQVQQLLKNRYNVETQWEKVLSDGIDKLTKKHKHLVIIDIDQVERVSLSRVTQVLQRFKYPCIFVGSDQEMIAMLEETTDNPYFSYLPKMLVSSMFIETAIYMLTRTTTLSRMKETISDVSQTQKPMSFYFLAAVLFMEPLIKILYMKFKTEFTWDVLFRTITSIEGIVPNLEFWLLFPLAGLALISIRTWSFPIFIAVIMYSLHMHITYEEFSWPYVDKTPHISSNIILLINILMISYFLVPENIRPFWNQTRRIWRNTKRYKVHLPALIKDDEAQTQTKIMNISETGAFIILSNPYPIGKLINLQIELDGVATWIPAIVRRSQFAHDSSVVGHGIEFNISKSEIKNKIKGLIQNAS